MCKPSSTVRCSGQVVGLQGELHIAATPCVLMGRWALVQAPLGQLPPGRTTACAYAAVACCLAAQS